MKKILIILIIGLALALALAAFSCKESDSPTPHKSTITAFGKTITVKGDASISTADFNTEKGKLETVTQKVPDIQQQNAQRSCVDQ